MRYYIQRNSHKIIKTILVLVALVVAAGGAKYYIANKGEIGKLDDRKVSTTVSDTSPAFISSRTLMAGNVNWGGHLNDLSQASELKTAYPFSDLSMLSRNEYDAWIANLNCALSDVPATTGSDILCPTEYVAQAKKWFSVFSLGNQSSADGGNDERTKQSLSAAGVQYAGNENMDTVKDLCDVVALPARFTLGDGSYKAAHLPLVFCSINTSSRTPERIQLDTIESFSKQLPVVVYAYMGDANVIGQSEYQKITFHSLIDAGADMVIGNHPYAVQGAESYKGKLIVYSLGNFIYSGQSSDAEYYKSVGIKATISSPTDANMLSWATLAQDCAQPADTCLAVAKEKSLTRPTYSYALSLLTTETSKENIVMKSEGTWQEQASKRLGWDALLPNLKYTSK